MNTLVPFNVLILTNLSNDKQNNTEKSRCLMYNTLRTAFCYA